MDQKKYRPFSSKILLFGEYLVLEGGKGLSFPYDHYSLKKSLDYNLSHRFFFQKLVAYLENQSILKGKISTLLSQEVSQGLQFESNIPVGYGLGSSGALVAAIYDEYFLDKEENLHKLKTILAAMESFFHNQSSGIDPLTSYLDKPILSFNDHIEILSEVAFKNFSLFDSGIKRNAKEAIQHFKTLKYNKNFKSAISQLKELSNTMVDKWIDNENIDSEMRQYSRMQLHHFIDFIPPSLRTYWQQGIDSQQYYMKLCGAGMGGMYLKFNTKL